MAKSADADIELGILNYKNLADVDYIYLESIQVAPIKLPEGGVQ